MGQKLQCEKCGRTMDEIKFYTYKDGRKTEMCKDCLTMHIDNYDPSTFLWLLEKMDVPYVPAEWNVLRDRAFAKNPDKMNGMSVFGKYLSKMKLKQWNQFGWADTEKCQAMADEKNRVKTAEKQEADEKFTKELQEKLAAGEISEAEYKTLMPAPTLKDEYVAKTSAELDAQFHNPFREEQFVQVDLPNPAADLTEDDMKYLAMKWGTLYKPQEWIELEKIYTEMTNSFDIQDADTINSLIIICKLNLKANQALDMGDYDGFTKLSRELGNQRKLANFAAAQRKKEEKNDFVDSVGELVAYCEKNGGEIPRFELDAPIDIIDTVIADLKEYTKSLIYADTALARQIEDYLKKKEILDQQKRDREEAKAKGLDVPEMSDEDFAEYYQSLDEQAAADAQAQHQVIDEEEVEE
jgi:hypothetical protein